MDTVTIAQFENEGDDAGCEFCEGRGYYPAPDGACDYATTLCNCAAGERREREIYQLMADNPDLL